MNKENINYKQTTINIENKNFVTPIKNKDTSYDYSNNNTQTKLSKSNFDYLVVNNSIIKDVSEDINAKLIKDDNNITSNNNNNNNNNNNLNTTLEKIICSIGNTNQIDNNNNFGSKDKEEQEEELSDSDSSVNKEILPDINLKPFDKIYTKKYDLQLKNISMNKLENTNTNKLNCNYCIEYDTKNNNKVNYLLDYCSELYNNNYYDNKIITWMIESKENLLSNNIDDNILKWIVKQDKKYYSVNNILNSITYRLSKFGKLAPSKDLVRKLNSETNEDNFNYYEDDSFIENENDDESINDYYYIKNSEKAVVCTSEEELITLINKRKKQLNIKKHRRLKIKNSCNLLGNKREKDNKYNINNNIVSGKFTFKELSGGDNKDKIFSSLEDYLKNKECVKDKILENNKNKYMLVKELLYESKRKKKTSGGLMITGANLNEPNFKIDYSKVAEFLELDYETAKILLDHELKKMNKDNKWASIYKSLHKFGKDLLLSLNNVQDLSIVDLNTYKIQMKLDLLVNKLNSFYFLYNDFSDFCLINNSLLKEYLNYPMKDNKDFWKNLEDKIKGCLDACKLSTELKDNIWNFIIIKKNIIEDRTKIDSYIVENYNNDIKISKSKNISDICNVKYIYNENNIAKHSCDNNNNSINDLKLNSDKDESNKDNIEVNINEQDKCIDLSTKQKDITIKKSQINSKKKNNYKSKSLLSKPVISKEFFYKQFDNLDFIDIRN